MSPATLKIGALPVRTLEPRVSKNRGSKIWEAPVLQGLKTAKLEIQELKSLESLALSIFALLKMRI